VSQVTDRAQHSSLPWYRISYDRKKCSSCLVDTPILSNLPPNIRLRWKILTVKNTLAYHSTELVMTVKSVLVVIIEVLILSTLPINIRLVWKSLPVRNTLAYHGTELVTTVKKVQ
jgi:hypothetical protein